MMNNKQKYDKTFLESFAISEDALFGLEYNSIPEWDSVGHMGLIAALAIFPVLILTEDYPESIGVAPDKFNNSNNTCSK